MLRLTLLPARQGDCIWIEYEAEGSTHHLVIDGGPEHAGVLAGEVERRIAAAPDGVLHIDLLVVTHIDNDHIGGVLELIEKLPDGLSFGDIWFNGYAHLVAADLLGVAQADRLSNLLSESDLPWNRAFGGGPIFVPEGDQLPRLRRNDVLELTLLGPSKDALVRLAREWDESVQTGETEPAPPPPPPADLLGRRDDWPPVFEALLKERFEPDTGAPNGSSIAMLLDYGGRRVLLGADATAGQLSASIRRLLDEEGSGERLILDACKVSHHGSKKNTDLELLGLVRCERWLISTDGSYFGHPDAAAVAALIVHGGPDPELIFNSRKAFALRWTEPKVPRWPRFRIRIPDVEGAPVTLEWPATSR